MGYIALFQALDTVYPSKENGHEYIFFHTCVECIFVIIRFKAPLNCSVLFKALEKAKEAGRKERLLVRQREQIAAPENINLDLTYSVSAFSE